MTDQPDNIILRRLQEMRSEIAARDEKTQAQIGVLAQGLNSVRNELNQLRTELGGELKGVRDGVQKLIGHVHELAMAVDHHTARLDRIEQRLGLDTSRH